MRTRLRAGPRRRRRRRERPRRYRRSRCCHARRRRRQYGARLRIGSRSRRGVSESGRRRHRRTMGLLPLPVAAGRPPAARHRRPTQAGAGPRRRRPGRSSRAGAAPPCRRLRLLGRLGSRIRALPPPTPLRRGEGRRVATSAAASTAPCTTLRPRRHTLGVAPAPVPGCRFRRLRSPCFRPGPAAARTCACATPTTTSKIAHRIVSATQRRRPPLVRALLLPARAVHQSLAAARLTRRFHPWARWGALESLLQGSKEVQQARQTAPARQERLRP